VSALLELKQVSKTFGGLRANWNVSFNVEERSITGLIGPNGAGKTTLFSCITGYYPPTHGDVVFQGKRLNGMQPDQVCRLGMVRTWQKVRPMAKLSVLENVMVGALLRTWSLRRARTLAEEQLHAVGLDKQAGTLAGALPIGQRKRLEVARALATQPALLLLDEVMGGLNPTESNEMIALILMLKVRGITLVVIEHDMRAIMAVSDRVLVLSSGELLAEGAPREVAEDPAVVDAYLGKRLEKEEA
jgi:branched-chain amino acid transport system ATP-binding protein